MTCNVRREFALAAQQARKARRPRDRQFALRRCDILLDRYLADRPPGPEGDDMTGPQPLPGKR